MAVSEEEKKSLKLRGYIMNRDGEHFAARVVTKNGVLTKKQIDILSDAAEKFGSGKIAMTTRMTVEVQGLTYETIEPFDNYIKAADLYTGGTGPVVRPVVVCKGTVCPHGLYDTQAMALEIHHKFYEGWHEIKLPHKFKIAVGGCPNSCVKPSLNDFGIEGWRADGKQCFHIYVGGLWGKHHRVGNMLEGVYTRDEVFELIEKTLLIYREWGKSGERFGVMLDRVGVDKFFKELKEGDVMARKDAILQAPIQK